MMYDNRAIWLRSLFLAAGSCAAGAQASKPDPCDKATSQADMNDCYGKQCQKDDAHLNRVYHKAMDFLQKDLAQTPDQDLKKSAQTAIDELKAGEWGWSKYGDLQWGAASEEYQGGTMASMIHSMCMSMATDHRI